MATYKYESDASTLKKMIAAEDKNYQATNKVAPQVSSKDIDINWEWDQTQGIEKALRVGTGAHINRVLFWLASKPCSYIRQGQKGGILYELLGKGINDASLKNIEETLSEAFKSEFEGDLVLLSVKATRDIERRCLVIDMTCRDPLYNDVFSTSLEVEDDNLTRW